MPEENKDSIKQQFHQANALITSQRYPEARQLLNQIDHPQAKVWLKQLDDKQKQSTPSTLFSTKTLLFAIGASVFILATVLGFIYAPTLIEALQPNTYEQYLDDTVVGDDEIIYSHIVGYCYHITGYGSELCLDWADLVIADFNAVAVTCVEPFMETGVLENEDYVVLGGCLSDASVPNPL